MKKAKNFYLFAGIICYKFFCDYVYDNVISELFSYQNFENNPNNKSIFISWLMVLLLSPLIIKINFQEKLSSSIVKVLVLCSFIPTCTMIGFHSSYEMEYIILIFIYWCVLLTSNIYMPKIIFGKSNYLQNTNFYEILVTVLCITIIFISFKYTGFRLQFDLINVYDVRAEARTYSMPTFLGYLATFSDNILPIALVYFLYRKKKIIALIIGFVIFLNYGITATKQIIFLLFLSILGYFFIRNLKFTNKFIWIFITLLFAGILEFMIFETWFISLLSTYRVFFIPAKLHYVYYNYFSTHEFDYFRQSFFKYFTESPYKDNIGFLMGYEDIGDFTARANNGLFTDAYYNFGIIGVLIFPLILVFILKILDGAVIGLNERFLFIIIISVSFILIGLPFSTALFSAGLIPLIIFLNSLKRESTNYG